MKHIFISHAGADAGIAKRLEGDLRNAGHETKIDTRELKLGDDAIKFMNDGIADAHTVIIFYSQYTPQANWQKLEINSAVWNEIAQSGGVCVVVRLDDTPIPPVLGPKVYGTVHVDDDHSYRKLLEDLCNAILPGKTASSLVSEAFRCESNNPFRRVRAEYFEDRPDLLAKTFAPPDALKTGALEEMKPCFLEGSRGTGKSMLLLSLRARNFVARHKASGNGYRIFGFYLKLSRGAICNAGVLPSAGGDPKTIVEQNSAQITDISSQEIIICILESLFSELDFCIRQKLFACDSLNEKALAEAAFASFFGTAQNPPRNLEELLDRLADLHRNIAEFIRRKFIYSETASVPTTAFDLDTLKRVIKLVRRIIPIFANATFMTLLDEYENLFPYQQRIVNSYVKLAPPDASVKIAKKIGTADTSGTMTGQDLQEIHDYTRVPLVYDVEDREQQNAYNLLLTHIVTNILKNEGMASPGLPLGIVGAVRLREPEFLGFHWNVPTSTVELLLPKAVNNAFTMTGAPAMMRPPMMESFPASVSPRRMAKPPPITQSVPNRNPMSMTMPNADDAPDDRLPVAACARSGVNLAIAKVFITRHILARVWKRVVQASEQLSLFFLLLCRDAKYRANSAGNRFKIATARSAFARTYSRPEPRFAAHRFRVEPGGIGHHQTGTTEGKFSAARPHRRGQNRSHAGVHQLFIERPACLSIRHVGVSNTGTPAVAPGKFRD
jgi:hypothetical protein